MSARPQVSSEMVERAFSVVPREWFLPDAQKHLAQQDVSVWLTRGSCASQPSSVAAMLNQLDLRVGDRVLEIGTGSGYNSALLMQLVGPEGTVVSTEIDPQLVERAQAIHSERGFSTIDVRWQDTYIRQGNEQFERVIATCALAHIPEAIFDALTEDGLIVVPLILRASIQVSVALRRATASQLRSESAQSIVFVPRVDADGRADISMSGFWDPSGQPFRTSGAASDVCSRILGEAVNKRIPPARLPLPTPVDQEASYTSLAAWIASGEPSVLSLAGSPDHDGRLLPSVVRRPTMSIGLSQGQGCAFLSLGEGSQVAEVWSYGDGARAADELITLVNAWQEAGSPATSQMHVTYERGAIDVSSRADVLPRDGHTILLGWSVD